MNQSRSLEILRSNEGKRDQCGYMIVSSRYDVGGGMQRGNSG